MLGLFFLKTRCLLTGHQARSKQISGGPAMKWVWLIGGGGGGGGFENL